ncbi:MAG: hypothetical protein LCI02_06380 [Proteobacteria bacterium]|nr:hypothetical protein [Pseudomonadota bacterium]
MRIKPRVAPASGRDGWRLSPVHLIVAAVIVALAGVGLWDGWRAALGVGKAAPVSLQAASARFANSDRNWRAVPFENEEGSRVWLTKTDLLLVLPDGQAFSVHCAWSGSACEHLRQSPQRGPIDAVVLPVEFAPHHWLIEATLDGKVLAQEPAQWLALRAKLSSDRNLLLATVAVVVLLLGWGWWLRSPSPARAARPKG